jgi:uncharacterized protein (TIGR02391 family)
MKIAADLAAYRKANLLPKTLLHPTIAVKVHAAFLRGEYDTAVFQAFREVEIAVRLAGRFSANGLGVDLMDKAFHKTNGPLTDQSVPESKREATRLFVRGAIGRYKNPHSHGHVPITDATEAVELLCLPATCYGFANATPPNIATPNP